MCVVFFSAKGISVWSEKTADITQNVQKGSHANMIDIPKVTRGVLPPEGTYEAVAVRDLFTSERAEPVEEEVEEEKKPVEEEPVVEKDLRVSGKKIVLYGVALKDDYRTALISDPKPKPHSRPFLWVREGEHIGDTDIVVSAIKKESVVLKNKDDLVEISLYDQEKDRGGVAGRGKRKSEERPVVVTTESAKKIAVEKNPSTAQKVSAQPSGRAGAPAGKGESYEVVDTPFGKIKRKKK